MVRNESAWVKMPGDRRASAARPPQPAAIRRDPAACRPEAEALLRDLAFVFRTTRAVRQAITGRDAR